MAIACTEVLGVCISNEIIGNFQFVNKILTLVLSQSCLMANRTEVLKKNVTCAIFLGKIYLLPKPKKTLPRSRN